MKDFSVVLGDENCYKKFRYPAGEMQVRLNSQTIESLRSKNTVVITARITSAEDIMELCLLTSAIRSQPAITDIRLILPYLPYGRADRRFVEGDCFGLEVFAGIINGLGLPVLTLDAHSMSSRSLLTNLTDLCPSQFLEQAVRDVRYLEQNSVDGSTNPLTILFPDDGARKRYAGLLTDLNISILHCSKVRDKASGHLTRFSVPSREEFDSTNVLLIDDICDGGGTFLGVAATLKQYGLNLSLYVTHAIFSKGLAPLLAEFRHIYTTDSFDCHFSDPRMTIYPTQEFFQKSLGA